MSDALLNRKKEFIRELLYFAEQLEQDDVWEAKIKDPELIPFAEEMVKQAAIVWGKEHHHVQSVRFLVTAVDMILIDARQD
jgi:hypothetical protein